MFACPYSIVCIGRVRALLYRWINKLRLDAQIERDPNGNNQVTVARVWFNQVPAKAVRLPKRWMREMRQMKRREREREQIEMKKKKKRS